MAHILTLLAENIFAVIGFTLYCGLVYYMIRKAIHKYSANGRNRKKRPDTARKNFSRHVFSKNDLSGKDFS